MLFNRSQGLDCTWPRFGSASQVCFENSPALRTLTTSTFKSEEEEEKGSLPACPSWVVSACLATYMNSKKICCKLCGKYAANLLPYLHWRVASNLAQGQQPRRHPGKAPARPHARCQPRAQGGILESPERSPTGWPVALTVAQWSRPFTKQCNLTYAGQWAGRIG